MLRHLASSLPPLHPFSSTKIQIFINDQSYQVSNNISIYQAAKQNGIQIPRFCYHERLKVAGNCRMCLVQVEKAPKPVASCSSQVAPAMRIHTNSEAARLARGGVMEFILANHPLDCPICDQGGQCDLQNHSLSYGFQASRHSQFKRAVEDKNIGPLVMTHMNRCIHCTRCIRFAQEVAGFNDLGTSGRGRQTQIGTYVQKMVFSQLSGNLADICPVGALNHGPTAYTIRPNELLSHNSIDLMDSLGSNVEVNHKENTVMRIQPRVHEEINEQWLSDKSRQAFDGLKRQRIHHPLVRRGQDFVEQEWQNILSLIAKRVIEVDGSEIACGIGEFESIESILALKDFLNTLNCFQYEFRRHNHYQIKNNFRTDYLFNTRIQNVEDADLILFIGVNPKSQTPLLNSRIFQSVNKNNIQLLNIGTPVDLTYQYQHVGLTPTTLDQIIEGQHPIIEKIKGASFPLMIVGKDALTRKDGQAILKRTKKIANQYGFVNEKTGWNGYNILNRSQGQINALELGINFKPIEIQPKIIFLLGCDNNIEFSDIPDDAFVVYIGCHGDQGAQYADVILPAGAYTEQTAIFVNAEGRVQLATKVVEPPGQAKQPWQIFRALSQECGTALQYDSISELRGRIYDINPSLLNFNTIENSVYGKISNYDYGDRGEVQHTPLLDTIDNYYMTDSISRNSITMAKCSTAFNLLKWKNFKRFHEL